MAEDNAEEGPEIRDGQVCAMRQVEVEVEVEV